jgi:hypothetical protein
MHYCMLINVIATDTRNAFSNLLSGLQGYAIARRYPDTAQGDPADYYVLGLSGTPALVNGQEVPVGFMLGYNQDCPTNVQNLIGNLAALAEGALSPNPPLDRPTLTARLRQMAGERGCDHVWEVKPGDDVTTGVTTAAALLAKFTPLT